jgi:hypothetical protein
MQTAGPPSIDPDEVETPSIREVAAEIARQALRAGMPPELVVGSLIDVVLELCVRTIGAAGTERWLAEVAAVVGTVDQPLH